MTLVSQIIKDAYRQSNILSITASPTTLQTAEALTYLNRINLSVFGNEAGEQLQSFPIGRNHINSPSGYPWYDQVPPGDWFVPKNQRLILNLQAAQTVNLHPMPDDGSRFGIIDVSNDLSTFPLTVNGNGRLLENSFSLVLNEDGLDRQWFYRGDLGNWMRLADLIESDTFPFPPEFDDLFITMLAMRLNPSYNVQLADESGIVLSRMQTQFRARYSQDIQVPVEDGLIRMPKSARDRDLYSRGLWLWGNANSMFNKGYPF